MALEHPMTAEIKEEIASLASLADRLIHGRTPVGDKTGTVDIEVDGGTVTITVKGCSRAAYLAAQKRFGDDEAAKERWLLAGCMVDPQLTAEQVEIWQKVSGPMEINNVQMKINELSGVKSGADKSQVD